MNRPYIICHMMASLDGRIDCSMTEKIDHTNNYYDALEAIGTPSHLSGKITMKMHNAKEGVFKPVSKTSVSKDSFKKMTDASAYTLSVDTKGELLWNSGIVENLPLICIVSQQASIEYLQYLEGMGISWIAAGEQHIDLSKVMEILRCEFGVERMAVVGGGHINGAFLAAGLIDEVSMMFAPAIDGRAGFAASFDGINISSEPFMLKLKSVQQLENGTVWIRYSVR